MSAPHPLPVLAPQDKRDTSGAEKWLQSFSFSRAQAIALGGNVTDLEAE